MPLSSLTRIIHHEYDQLIGVFTEREAWVLFRASAYLETIGWCLLITGILFKRFGLPANEFVLPIGGSLHGVFVVIYTLIVFFTHRSLNWSIKRFIFAEVISSIPFAALVFELWVAKKRTATNERSVRIRS